MTEQTPQRTAERGAQGGVPELSETDYSVLQFERGWWRFAGAKEQAINAEFGMTPTQYYQVLNRLIDSPAALAAEPLLVKRLRRLRDSRQRERSDARAGRI